MRRQALNPAFGDQSGGSRPPDVHDLLFYGPFGALNPSGDLILENRQWRERLFAYRAPQSPGPSAFVSRMNGVVNFMFPGGMGGGGLALNQLLVVMDGIDNPPFFKKLFTSKTNALLDGIYIVPRRIGKRSIRIPAARPRREQIYFIGATNVPVDRLDPALTRPGRMGRHVWFRTPTKQDRLDVLDLYLGKVAHDAELDQPHKREEIARVTNGYAPAMLEQVTSMALTIAHHSDRDALTWEDLVEAMTTLEAGTAVGIEYIPEESRAVAIHEAGHAAAGHVYLKGAESTRLSIRMRGGALGHHQALEKEERFSRFRSEEFARLVWALGAMAAERVFYGENSNGVGGDVMSVTAQAAYMVGASAMGPEPFAVTPREDETEEEARERILKRFEKIGLQIVNRTGGGGPFSENPIGTVLGDRDKRAIVGQIVGQAYVAAYNLIVANRDAVEHIADVLNARRELFGDELMNLLDEAKITIPKVDLSEESSWPTM
jgi:cell division protease FtsH